MGKTTEVAADRAYDQTKTVLPTEVAQGGVRSGRGQNSTLSSSVTVLATCTRP